MKGKSSIYNFWTLEARLSAFACNSNCKTWTRQKFGGDEFEFDANSIDLNDSDNSDGAIRRDVVLQLPILWPSASLPLLSIASSPISESMALVCV